MAEAVIIDHSFAHRLLLAVVQSWILVDVRGKNVLELPVNKTMRD